MFATKLKTCNENKVDFKVKTYVELLELLDRQKKILSNKRFIDGLPDKGDKLNKFLAQLETEVEKRQLHEKLCRDMTLLSISKEQLDTFEWTGKLDPDTTQKSSSHPDTDDNNVLKMFISHSGVYQDKILIKEKTEEPLIKPSDLIEEERNNEGDKSKTFPENIDPYAKTLCGRIDTHLSIKTMHVPLNKPAKPNKHSVVKAATVSLKESVMLQFLHENKLKELQVENLKRKPVLRFLNNSYRESKLFNDIDDSDENNSIDSDDDDDDD